MLSAAIPQQRAPRSCPQRTPRPRRAQCPPSHIRRIAVIAVSVAPWPLEQRRDRAPDRRPAAHHASRPSSRSTASERVTGCCRRASRSQRDYTSAREPPAGHRDRAGAPSRALPRTLGRRAVLPACAWARPTAAAPLLAAGCSPSGRRLRRGPSPKPREARRWRASAAATLIALWAGDTDNIDPGITYSQRGTQIVRATQKTLYRRGSTTRPTSSPTSPRPTRRSPPTAAGSR